MAYDEELARRIDDVLAGEPGVTSRKMFGGLGFMVDGHMAVAAASDGSLMVRADPADAEAWVDGPSVAPMEMRGRPMTGWLLVSPDVLADDGCGSGSTAGSPSSGRSHRSNRLPVPHRWRWLAP
jgi:hypothetical protein